MAKPKTYTTASGRQLTDADIDAIDPELRAAMEERAKADNMTTSEVIREAPRRFLDVA